MELEVQHVTEDGPIIGRDVAYIGAGAQVAARPGRLDPGRGVDEKPLTRAQDSSRIRRSSSWVMKPSRVPNLSTNFWSLRRLPRAAATWRRMSAKS